MVRVVELFPIVLSGLGVVASVLLAFAAVRYDQRLARRQAAADRLIEWAYRVGALASDAIHEAIAKRHIRQSQGFDWGEAERWARLDYERFAARLPERLQTTIAPSAQDLLTIARAVMPPWPDRQLAGASWNRPPPPDLLTDPNASHGGWLDSLISDLRDPLELYAAKGELPGRWPKPRARA